MSQALVTITQSRRPAQTFRVGYDMPAREFETGADVLASSMAVRKRLNPLQVVRVHPAPTYTFVVQDKPLEPIDDPEYGCPVNMLLSPSWRFLVALAALKHDVSPDDILGQSRVRHICAARHYAVYLVASHISVSLPRIGLYFGGRDHTTILNSLKRFPPIDRPDMRKTQPLRGNAPIPYVNPNGKKVCAAGTENTLIQPREIKHRTVLPGIERAVAQAFELGISSGDVADRFGCTPSYVRLIASRNGLRRKDKLKWVAQGVTAL